MMQNMGVRNTVEDMPTDETHIPIDGARSASDECPGFRIIVGKRWIGVLKVGDCDYTVIRS